MRISVAGATGAVGRELIRVLISSGHQIIGSTRSPAKAEMITRLGAEAVVADGLEPQGLYASRRTGSPLNQASMPSTIWL
jgi:uncharacterized protein YbjT (DUF2867 family)